MKRGILGAAIVVAAVAGVSTPAQAGSDYKYVTVTVDPENGRYGVGTSLPNQPLVGARYDAKTGEFCAGFSYQIPFCVQVPIGIDLP